MRFARIVWIWLQITGASAAVVAVTWLGAQYVFHLSLLNVQTASMQPAFRPGDALIMQRVRPNQLKPGMIVSYRSPRNPDLLISHRVVAINKASASFQTKGDVLSTPDPAAKDASLAGRVAVMLPGMGRALGWLQTLPGLIACIYVPAAAIAAQELRRLERRFAQLRPYRIRGPKMV